LSQILATTSYINPSKGVISSQEKMANNPLATAIVGEHHTQN
jgi:hypothetical protein